MLLATVAQCWVEVLDEIVGRFDLALPATTNWARRKLDVQLAARARASEYKLELLEEILVVVTDPAVADAQFGERLRGEVGMDRMRAARRPHAVPRPIGCSAITDTSR